MIIAFLEEGSVGMKIKKKHKSIAILLCAAGIICLNHFANEVIADGTILLGAIALITGCKDDE